VTANYVGPVVRGRKRDRAGNVRACCRPTSRRHPSASHFAGLASDPFTSRRDTAGDPADARLAGAQPVGRQLGQLGAQTPSSDENGTWLGHGLVWKPMTQYKRAATTVTWFRHYGQVLSRDIRPGQAGPWASAGVGWLPRGLGPLPAIG